MACNSNQRLECFRKSYTYFNVCNEFIRITIYYSFSMFFFSKIYVLNFLIVISKVFCWHFCDIWRCVTYSLHLKLATRLLSICMILWTFDIWYALWVSLLGFFNQFLKNDESSNIILSSQENFSHYQSSNFKNTSCCRNRYRVMQLWNGPNLLSIIIFCRLVNPKFHNQVNYLHQKF